MIEWLELSPIPDDAPQARVFNNRIADLLALRAHAGTVKSTTRPIPKTPHEIAEIAAATVKAKDEARSRGENWSDPPCPNRAIKFYDPDDAINECLRREYLLRIQMARLKDAKKPARETDPLITQVDALLKQRGAHRRLGR